MRPTLAEVGTLDRNVDVRGQCCTPAVIREISSRYPSTSALPHLPGSNYSKTPEVVRMQHNLFHEQLVGGSDDIDRWTSTHNLLDFIDLTKKKKILKIQYKNGDEQDVYEGAFDRLEQQRMVRRKPACILDLGACIVGSLADHPKLNRLPPPPFNRHNSSADDCSIGRNSSECGEQSFDNTNERKQINSDETMLDTIPVQCWDREQ